MHKILVVDDELEILEITKKRLENNGYQVIVLSSGKDVLNVARQEKPDLVILDIVMPDKDGFSVLKELKIDEDTRFIPVIMLTARGETNSLLESGDYGATDYFIKPCDWEELLKYIKKYIH